MDKVDCGEVHTVLGFLCCAVGKGDRMVESWETCPLAAVAWKSREQHLTQPEGHLLEEVSEFPNGVEKGMR